MVYSPTPRVFSERDIRLALSIGSHVAHGVARHAADLAVGQALRARDEILAVVSHDLRNPVNTLTITVSSLLHAASRQQDQMLHLKAARMQRSLTAMNRLIGDLLDVSAVDRGALQVQLEDIELEPVVADAIDLLRPLVEERRQELKVEVPPGLVRADRHRVIQVLSNIIGNATKFAPVGGWIRVQARNLDLPGQSGVEVSVTDNGPGIAPEHLSRIFERFWRPRQEPQGAGQGVGLGLAIARGVVEAHGGRISVENVTLPRPLASD